MKRTKSSKEQLVQCDLFFFWYALVRLPVFMLTGGSIGLPGLGGTVSPLLAMTACAQHVTFIAVAKTAVRAFSTDDLVT